MPKHERNCNLVILDLILEFTSINDGLFEEGNISAEVCIHMYVCTIGDTIISHPFGFSVLWLNYSQNDERCHQAVIFTGEIYS